MGPFGPTYANINIQKNCPGTSAQRAKWSQQQRATWRYPNQSHSKASGFPLAPRLWFPEVSMWVDWCRCPNGCTETAMAEPLVHAWIVMAIDDNTCKIDQDWSRLHGIMSDWLEEVWFPPVFLGNLSSNSLNNGPTNHHFIILHPCSQVDMPVLITSLASPQAPQWAPAWSKEWQIPPLQRWRSRIRMAPMLSRTLVPQQKPQTLTFEHEAVQSDTWEVLATQSIQLLTSIIIYHNHWYSFIIILKGKTSQSTSTKAPRGPWFQENKPGTRIRNFTELPLGSKMNSMDAWMSPTGSSILARHCWTAPCCTCWCWRMWKTHPTVKCETLQAWAWMDMMDDTWTCNLAFLTWLHQTAAPQFASLKSGTRCALGMVRLSPSLEGPGGVGKIIATLWPFLVGKVDFWRSCIGFKLRQDGSKLVGLPSKGRPWKIQTTSHQSSHSRVHGSSSVCTSTVINHSSLI